VITVEREAAACAMGRKLPPHDAASIPIGSLRRDWSVTVCSVEGFTLRVLEGRRRGLGLWPFGGWGILALTLGLRPLERPKPLKRLGALGC
jgi:hypothetical protein